MREARPDEAAGETSEQRVTLDRRQRRRIMSTSGSSVEHSMMFVCAANVCRSPVMAYSFAEGVRSAWPAGWNVSSGGVSARAPLPICELAVGVLRQHGVDGDVVSSHRALRVELDHLDRQDLVIAASKDERAVIAMMRPALRNRTFTLNEAVALGAAPVSADERHTAAAALGDDTGPLALYAGVLHLRRGTMPVPSPLPPSRRPRRSADIDPYDIPDVHHRRRRPHLAMLESSWESTEKLRGQVVAFLEADEHR